MARKNIFDILEGKLDINFEIRRIEELCEMDAIEIGGVLYTMEGFVDAYCLENWKNRNRFISCDEIRQKLEITDFFIRKKLNNNQVLMYLEYIANMVQLCNDFIENDDRYGITKSYIYLQDNLLDIIEKLNYEVKVFENDEKVLLVEKNEATTAVAEIIEPELAYEIIEYNHHLLKGDIEKKQRILKVLADKFEPMRGELRKINKELESNTGYLLNKMNICHNNIEGKNAIAYVKNLSRDELEEWYDDTYQMLLLSILEFDNIKRNAKVDELKKNIEVK